MPVFAGIGPSHSEPDLGAQQLNSLSALFDGNTRSMLSPLLLPDSPRSTSLPSGAEAARPARRPRVPCPVLLADLHVRTQADRMTAGALGILSPGRT